MYVHTIPRFKVLNEIAASGSLHLQVLATLIDGDKPELRSTSFYDYTGNYYGLTV